MTTTPLFRDPGVRHDWTRTDVERLFALPFLDLLLEAQRVHRLFFPKNKVQLAELLSVKTGGCPEDCAYCPQSAHHDTGLERTPLMAAADVVVKAGEARARGASRFCLGAAWRSPSDKDLDAVCEMVKGIKALGMEACVTLGMLTGPQAAKLKAAGLDYYNHNLDTSPEHYREIITTRTFDDRLQTLAAVRDAGVSVCCGGIVGMGESRADRAGFLVALATLDPHPESVPINMLVQVKGMPLAILDNNDAPSREGVDGIELVRTVAAARLTMPKSVVRLSAGRETMSDELQALCFLAGANSIFAGEQLLTTKNPGVSRDERLFAQLGLAAWVPGGTDAVERHAASAHADAE